MLSIIIPTLNEGKNLPRLLKALKKQTFKDYEIIISDAGSTDRTLDIARSYGCKIVKGGLPARGRNEGAKAAQGEMLLFTDADNILVSETFLETVIKIFTERGLGVASFSIYPQGNFVDKFAYKIYNFWVKVSQSFLPHATNTILVEEEVHQAIKGFDEQVKLAEDHEYVRRASRCGKFGFIEEGVILTSARRMEEKGRVKTYLKYLLAGLYMLVLGPIKSDFFRYDMGKWLEKRD
ncbi:MAG: glycosyltransferase [Candidatus Nealsonbacteria bacterium]|nr:glycosyltransferase [Candidatus Nealsonbacteria bacterium]